MYFSNPEVKAILLFSITKALGVSSSNNEKLILLLLGSIKFIISEINISIS